jgi:hypothetical protein
MNDFAPLPEPESANRQRLQGSPTEAEIKAFVGSNAAYYRRQWAGALLGEPGGTGFNWVAFLLAGIWLPYRRFYGQAFLIYGLFMVITLVEALLAGPRYTPNLALGCFQYVLGAVIAVVVGCNANSWYLARFRRAVTESRAREQSTEEHLKALSRLGGTDLLAMFAFPMASVVLSVIVNILLFGFDDL